MTQYGQYEVPGSETMVNFGVGQPSKILLPLSKIKSGISEVLNIEDPSLLQYGDIPGYYTFRKDLSNYLTVKYEREVIPESLFVTNGVTGGLSLICSLFAKRNTTIFVEEPTYFLAINIFKDFNLNIRPITIEADGIDTNELEVQLSNLADPSNSLLYTIPTFHNPTSYTMSEMKRRKIGELSDRYNMTVIADEVYQLLYFDEEDKPPAPLYYYGDNMISLGSFSKILAPSLRLGWIQTSEKIMKRLVSCGQLDSSGGINPFISAIVHNIISSGELEKNILFVREQLKERCNILCNSLRKFTKYAKFVQPKGGYFVWANIPDIDTVEMCEKSIKNRVRYHSGNKFSADNRMKDYLRLSFSYYNLDDIEVGIQRLAEIINNEFAKERKYISVIGYGGKLGSKILNEMESDEKYILHQKIGRIIDFIPSTLGKNIIIDVSSPTGTENLINYLIENEYRVPLIIGTTGVLPFELIKRYSLIAPVGIISNFSDGVPMFLDFAKSVDLSKWHVKIMEKHHTNKKDAPSGTAKTIAACMNSEVEIESIREGECYGEHMLELENENELLRILHVAKNRKIFAKGAIRYIDWISEQQDGIYYSKKEIGLCFQKYSGTGNDFIIIDNDKEQISEAEIKDIVIKICDRKKSVGADGVILLRKPHNKLLDFIWTYYNRDGSCAEMCGNGARCIAKYYYDNIEKKSILNFKNNWDIVTSAEIIGNVVKISMPKLINANITFPQNFLTDLYKRNINYLNCYIVGVPHIILNVKDIDQFNVNKICDELVTSHTTLKNFNINFTEKVGDQLKIRTYERGIWRETEACGTGCCASGYYYRRYLSDKIDVKVSSGNIIKMDYTNLDRIYLEGGVEKIFSGSYIKN